jgi:hypothetical protein
MNKLFLILFFLVNFSSNLYAYNKEACEQIEDFLLDETDRSISKPVDVWVDLILGELIEIDGKKENFTANVEFSITWQDNNSLSLAKNLFGNNSYRCTWDENDNIIGNFNFFTPAFGWTNKIDYDEDKEFEEVSYTYWAEYEDEPASVEMGTKKKVVSKFKTDFNYRSFPFDTQKIGFGLINYDSNYFETWGHENITIRMQQKDPDLLLKRSSQTVSGWDLGDQTLEKYIQKIDEQNTHTSIANLSQELTRNSGYYVFKVIGPILIILIICWSVFWTSSKELESRLTVTIVCFLSLIAYNYVIDDELPKLSYLTLMDYIVLLSYVFAAVPSILSIISHRYYQANNNEFLRIDRWAGIAGPILFIIFLYLLTTTVASINIDHSDQILRTLTFN